MSRPEIRIRDRHETHTCTACRVDVQEAFVYTVGDLVFALCLPCTHKLTRTIRGRFTRRETARKKSELRRIIQEQALLKTTDDAHS